MRFSQSAAEPDSVNNMPVFSAHAQATLQGTPNQPITWEQLHLDTFGQHNW